MRHYIASKNRIKANRDWHERNDSKEEILYIFFMMKKIQRKKENKIFKVVGEYT